MWGWRGSTNPAWRGSEASDKGTIKRNQLLEDADFPPTRILVSLCKGTVFKGAETHFLVQGADFPLRRPDYNGIPVQMGYSFFLYADYFSALFRSEESGLRLGLRLYLFWTVYARTCPLLSKLMGRPAKWLRTYLSVEAAFSYNFCCYDTNPEGFRIWRSQRSWH